MKRIIDNDMPVNITGSQIKELRTKAGLSQRQLSEKLELEAVYTCRGSISRIENGQRAVTDIELMAIAKVLGVDINMLFDVKQ
ncbi:MAG: helix-turn-helix transcriptional regulator [Ruminococcaceae bacterium]|nr:helix-turn-helix transcriptional regulator [Oscillospiraceae bacterium]